MSAAGGRTSAQRAGAHSSATRERSRGAGGGGAQGARQTGVPQRCGPASTVFAKNRVDLLPPSSDACSEIFREFFGFTLLLDDECPRDGLYRRESVVDWSRLLVTTVYTPVLILEAVE